MGSVKDLVWIEEPAERRVGAGRFVFSNRYSVFDWGEMPDHIPHKGEALCLATAYFFEELERNGFRTHYLGLVEGDSLVSLEELRRPTDTLQFKGVRVIHPVKGAYGYDYSPYRDADSCFLIPLEFIYRNSLPPGSSVFRRLEEGSLKLEDLGLEDMPVPGQVLLRPILDVSTKLEASDRYLSWEEARDLAFMKEEEFSEIKKAVLAIDDLITARTSPLGLFHEDGKLEFAFDEERRLMLVDTLGTLDECRFSYQNIPVSKEIARIHYRGSPWHREIEEAKKKDPVRWKSLVKSMPEPLPADLVKAISQVYMAFANELTGKEWFPAPPLRNVLEGLRDML